MITNQDLQDSVLTTQQGGIPTPYHPIRPIGPPTIRRIFPLPVPPKPINTQLTNTSGKGGVPKALLSVAAVQSPVANQSFVYSAVTVSFTVDPSDVNFDHVDVWFKGYHGNLNAQLVAAGAKSPITFVVDATGESVSVFAQTVSQSGQSALIDFAAQTTVLLNGKVSNPPAPTISQSLTATPLGYQFSFNQVSLPANDVEVISAYRIYRNTSANTFSGATLIRVISQDPTATGAIVVQDNVGGNKQYYYFVTSVNSVGLESSSTAAQSGAVSSSTVSSANNAPINTSSLPTGANPLSQSGTTTTILVAASSLKFGFGTVSYNSGSVNPGSYGTFYVYADDPTYSGGAVTYVATSTYSDLTAADGRVVFGKIVTTGGGGGTGTGGGGPTGKQTQ